MRAQLAGRMKLVNSHHQPASYAVNNGLHLTITIMFGLYLRIFGPWQKRRLQGRNEKISIIKSHEARIGNPSRVGSSNPFRSDKNHLFRAVLTKSDNILTMQS